MTKVLNCSLEVSEFEIQSRYYVHFRTNTFGKGIELPYLSSYVVNENLKKLWKMKVTVLPFVIGALRTIPKGFAKRLKDLEIRGKVETIKTTEYWEESWRLEETCCHSNFNEKPSANAGVKNSQRSKVKVKLATIVEGYPKAPFSIATTPRCRGGRYSFPRISPLYPWSVPYNAEC